MSAYPSDDVAVRAVGFHDDLHLRRTIESVQQRTHWDAEYVIAEPYRATVTIERGGLTIHWPIQVPEGFLTDLASVPRLARSIIARTGPWLEASVLHDWLYVAWQVEGIAPTRAQRHFADRVLWYGMVAARVGWSKRVVIYGAVRLFGRRTFMQPEGGPILSGDHHG